MQPGQFQIESLTAKRSCPPSRTTAPTVPSDASLLTLLAGVTLRGHLCDADRELLDRLALPHTLIFLVLGNSYLHPEGLEIVPMDQIEATLNAGQDAVFSHRQHLSDDLGRKTRTVRTAFIGQTVRGPLVLGMLGAELPKLRDHHDCHFSSIIQSFRTHLKTVSPFTCRLSEQMSRPEPTIVVGRSTGRILALNASATALLSSSNRHPVGEEFSTMKRALQQGMGRNRLSMENSSHSGLDITTITVLSPVAKENTSSPKVGAGFLQSMRQKTAGITAAARFLQSALDQEAGHPVAEMLRIIVDEAAELDHDLCRHQLMAEYTRFAPETIDPIATLRKSVEARVMGHACHGVTLREELNTPVRVELPRKALLFLYESILSTHCGRGSNSKTDVVARHGHGSNVTITFTTDCGRPLDRAAYVEWREYCDRLAELMSLPLEHQTSDDFAKTETILTLIA